MTALPPAQRPDRELRIGVQRGDLPSALAFLQRHRPATLEDAVRVISPIRTPTVDVFDAIADAWALHTEHT